MGIFIVCRSCSGFNTRGAALCYRCGRFLPREADARAARPDLRQDDRQEVGLQAVISKIGGIDKDEAYIENICLQGMMFRSDSRYCAGDEVRIQVRVDGVEYEVTAQVRHISEDAGRFAVGVCYTEAPQAFTNHVRQLCRSVGASELLVVA